MNPYEPPKSRTPPASVPREKYGAAAYVSTIALAMVGWMLARAGVENGNWPFIALGALGLLVGTGLLAHVIRNRRRSK